MSYYYIKAVNCQLFRDGFDMKFLCHF